MRKNIWLLLVILALLIIAVASYFWTAGLMGSMFEYRSPLKDNPPAPGEAIGPPMTRKVVFVLIDALREDTSRKTGVMPTPSSKGICANTPPSNNSWC